MALARAAWARRYHTKPGGEWTEHQLLAQGGFFLTLVFTPYPVLMLILWMLDYCEAT